MEEKLEKEYRKAKNKTRFIIVLIVSIITLIVGYVLFRGTYLETLEIGENYISIFWQNVKFMTITLIANFTIVFFSVFITNKKIKKCLGDFFKQENKPMPKLINKSISFIIAIVVSIFTSNILMQKAMLCFNNARFEIQDPIFGLDIGYFVFIKPFIEIALWYFIILIFGLMIYSTVYYIATFNMFFEGIDKKTLKNSNITKHLIIFVMILSVLAGLLIFFQTQGIGSEKFLSLNNSDTSYSLYGAGFTDVTVKLWGYRFMGLAIIFSAYRAVVNFKRGNKKKVIISLCIVPAYLLVLFFVLVMFQAIFVGSNELDKQKEYIQKNIEYTKNAYNIAIDEVKLRDEDNREITDSDLENYENVVDNIAIVSDDLVLKDIQKSQTSKGYYSYINTGIGNYIVNGKDKLVYLSPREINNSGTYNNKTYEYTHGYSVLVTSASDTKENGNLNHIQKNIENTDEVITIAQPRIYFGMQTNSTVVTNTASKEEFDYIGTDSNVTNNYDGKAGLKLNFIDRIIMAIKEGDINIAFSSDVTGNSKVLTNRNIIQRAKVLMPYLIYDDNPYMVVNSDGKLIWVLDAYTISNDYPYSQKTVVKENSTSKFELNYIRNSVKVLIDSYDGTISFYITDRTDPIAMAYRNIYPDLFVDLEQRIPEDISQHFVYPEYLYKIQANILTRYHNVEPDVLYRSGDIWQISSYNTTKVITRAGTEIKPYYTMVKTVDSDSDRLGLVLPYSPEGRQNLISYLIGSYNSEAGRMELKLYKYSSDENVLGTMQLDTQLQQDDTIMNELDALNVNGIKIIKNILVIPLDNSLLYVEPIFTTYTNEADSLPILRKVIVASKNKVAIGNNLAEALSNLVSQYAVNIEVENTDTIDDLIDTIIKANHNLTESNASNNWEMMGKDVSKIQELINKLEQLVEEDKKIKNELNAEQIEDSSNVLENVIE